MDSTLLPALAIVALLPPAPAPSCGPAKALAGALAQGPSQASDGITADGSDGFLRLGAKDEMRTTDRAFPVWRTGGCHVPRGDDMRVPPMAGALLQVEDRFAGDGTADGVVRAGAGKDVFMRCPRRALAAFERAAAMGSAAAGPMDPRRRSP